jgi:hypothetical protein
LGSARLRKSQRQVGAESRRSWHSGQVVGQSYVAASAPVADIDVGATLRRGLLQCP